MGIHIAYLEKENKVFAVFGDAPFNNQNESPSEIVRESLNGQAAFAHYYALDNEGIDELKKFISSYRNEERNVQGWMRNAQIKNELDKMTWNEFDSIFIDNKKISDSEIDGFISGLSSSPDVDSTCGCGDVPSRPEEVREEDIAEKLIPIPKEAVLPFPLPDAVAGGEGKEFVSEEKEEEETAEIAGIVERLKAGGNIQAAELLKELCSGLESIKQTVDLSFNRLAAYASLVAAYDTENKKQNDNAVTKADCEKIIEGLKRAMEILP